MIQPPINDLMKTMDSKYSLVIATAKRARAIASGQAEPLVDIDPDKPVTVAVHEIAEGKIVCEK